MTVFGSAVDVVEQYVAEIRPCFGAPRHPAMFLTERGTRIALAYINVALGASAQPDSDERTLASSRIEGGSLKRDSLPLTPQSERADGGAVAPARDDIRAS